GSGKESFSKIIHHLSNYKHGEFIAINCGAIPEGTIDSELFGHEKGAFTGALDKRKGYFEEADEGTIFLDEIGEMPLGTQARLLRVLEYGEFIKVGSSKVQQTKVRVVAATHINLLTAIEKGKFREDLYYRLNTVPIYVPPLREREDDIFLLFRKFAADFAEQYRVKPIQLTEEARQVLQQYRFPGNIRQLKNLVTQMAALTTTPVIEKEQLLSYLPKENNNLPMLHSEAKEEHFSERELLYQVLFDMKRDVLELKKLVLTLLNNDAQGNELLKGREALFQQTGDLAIPLQLMAPLKEKKVATTPPTIPEENKGESLSVEAQEKALIMKALKKHNHKRKYAAESLGIS
ncbi:MAG: sigma 54-interacting transcriptional regulator, partial [Bacteroidota bacterium]